MFDFLAKQKKSKKIPEEIVNWKLKIKLNPQNGMQMVGHNEYPYFTNTDPDIFYDDGNKKVFLLTTSKIKCGL